VGDVGRVADRVESQAGVDDVLGVATSHDVEAGGVLDGDSAHLDVGGTIHPN